MDNNHVNVPEALMHMQNTISILLLDKQKKNRGRRNYQIIVCSGGMTRKKVYSL